MMARATHAARRGALALVGALAAAMASGVAQAESVATSSTAAPATSATPATPDDAHTASDSAEGAKIAAAASAGAGVLAGTSDGRSYYVLALAQLRMLAVTDPDPTNDRSGFYRLEVGYEPFARATAYVRLGATQRFVTFGEAPAFDLQDLQLGVAYLQSLPLDALGLAGKALTFRHRATVSFPTSFQGRRTELIAAPELASTVRFLPHESLLLAFDLSAQYRFHRFADAPGGGLNRRFTLGAFLLASWTPLSFETFGDLSIGGTLSSAWVLRYPANSDFESAASSTNASNQDLGWSVFLSWSPIPIAWVSVALEQGAWLLREGVVSFTPFHRDQTELTLTVGVRY